MWISELWDAVRAMRVVDILDIALIACLLYLLLLWFKKTKAAFVARGMFIFALAYVAAERSGMYLTTWLFQGFFAVIIIALVVIFQEELRSFFERLAVWSWKRHRSRPLSGPEVEALLRSLVRFTRSKTGALIVLKGADPLERHVEGGVELDGRLSEPLLSSLFDPHSPGHDGAVVVDGARVVRFSAHLPLSTEFSKLEGLGTRHTAALGLAERTDALCLVVSEQRGTISIARNGNLFLVPNVEDAGEEISRFIHDKTPAAVQPGWRAILKENYAEKLLALATALTLWFVFVQRFQPSVQTLKVPVRVVPAPPGFKIVGVRPAKVELTVKGLKRDLQNLKPGSLPVTVRPADVQAGRRFYILSDDDVEVPDNVDLAEITPGRIEVTYARTAP